MAPRAMRRHARERGHGHGHHIVAIQHASQILIGRALPQFRVAHVIPRPRRDKAEGHRCVRVVRKQRVPRKLLLHEPRIRLVVIEGLNDVIPIRPRIPPRLVFVVPVRLAVVHHIQPVPPPALPVSRRRQQTIYQPLISPRRGIRHESRDLFRRRRQPVEIVSHPPDQRPTVRLRRRPQPLLLQLVENKAIDRSPGRKRRPQRLQRPPLIRLRPRRARLDPLPYTPDLRHTQRFPLARHARRAIRDQLVKQTLPGLARHHRRPARPALPHRRRGHQRQTAAPRLVVMTVLAPRRKKLLHSGIRRSGKGDENRNGRYQPHAFGSILFEAPCAGYFNRTRSWQQMHSAAIR